MSGTLFHASLICETSSFTSIPTAYADFEPSLRRGDECLFDANGAPRPELAPLFTFARRRGWSVQAGIAAQASVGAPMPHRDYLRLRDALLSALRASMPSVVALALHGAMMSSDCDDCEGDLLAEARAIVGPDVPVVAVLDPHAHLTDRMVANADVLVFMKEYPHTDGGERMAEALAIAGAMIDGRVRPVAAVADCRLLGFFPTRREPMRGFVDRLVALEGRPGIMSVSFVHGFPWGDTPETGAKLLVYADGDAALAATVAREMREEAWALRDRTMPDLVDAASLMRAAAEPRSAPLVAADVADNPGGGAPSDSTFLLRAMLEARVKDAAIGLLYDPIAARICHQAGVGARLALRVGGKMGPTSGEPVDLDADVMGLVPNAVMTVAEGVAFPMGDTAWVRANGIDIVLSTIRVQMYHPHGFSHIGIDPAAKLLLVVKSSTHFEAFFAPIADTIVHVGTPGAIDFDFRRLPYKRLTRPVHPRVSHPFDNACP